MPPTDHLSRRERQIMDIVYAHAAEGTRAGSGGATAEDVEAALPDPPTRTAVRTFLRMLEDRGLLRHEKRGRAFVYQPVKPPGQAGKSALRRVVETFFGGSLEKALTAHLADESLTTDEIRRLEELIEKAKVTRASPPASAHGRGEPSPSCTAQNLPAKKGPRP
jgi:BlaI family transcriptional regulator, penicillinase repressor